MSFFMSADYSLSTKVMEIIYFIIGLLCIYCGVKNLKDKENPEPVGTFIFWAVLGVVLALGRWLPSLVSGILVVVMCIPAILKKVKKGAVYACPAKDGTGEFTSSNPYGSEAAVPASTTVVPLKSSGVLEQCDIAAHLRRRLVPLWITAAAFSALLAAFVRL